MPNKVCTKCGIAKSSEEFTKDRRRWDGIRAQCKVCCKVIKVRYRSKPETKEKEKRDSVAWRRNNPIRFMLYCAKRRAKRDNLTFDLTLADISIPDICPILGIRLFQNLNTGKQGPSPNSPSLDKIVPELGYVKSNIQVISNRANTMKQDASLDEIIALGKWAEAQKEG